jgi:hypothetical protein
MVLGAPAAEHSALDHRRRTSTQHDRSGAGLIAAFAVTRVLRSLLVSVTPTDPMTFVGMTAMFVVIAAVACWLPARRAAALGPTLRCEAE